MRALTKQELIGWLRSLLILAGAIVMVIAMSPLSVDAAELEPGDEQDEKTCAENGACGQKIANGLAGSVISRGGGTQRSPGPPIRTVTIQTVVEMALRGETAQGAGTVLTGGQTPVIISEYRRALEAYLTVISTLLPEPASQQHLLPNSAFFPSPTAPNSSSRSSLAVVTSSLVPTEETSCHQQEGKQHINRVMAHSLLNPDLEARIDERARRGIISNIL